MKCLHITIFTMYNIKMVNKNISYYIYKKNHYFSIMCIMTLTMCCQFIIAKNEKIKILVAQTYHCF